jgi:UDP-N-acetylmuramoyl-tripeptide--D-alanyl-D-alanine ligase
MRSWSVHQIAAAAAGTVVVEPAPVPGGRDPGPTRTVVDSRLAGPGDLFVGVGGSNVDGGAYAADALARGAWGVLVGRPHAAAAAGAARPGAVLAHEDPLAALGMLAGAWRGELGAHVVGITGSTGKTSTKDILAALLGDWFSTVASPENHNTEIGMPLTILAAPPGTEALVLEMAMRAPGQIAELAEIARPDVGVVVNIGPVHLQQLGSIEAIAAAKAELIAGLPEGATAVIPAAEPLLDRHRRAALQTVTFGPGGDVSLDGVDARGVVSIAAPGRTIAVQPSFRQAHNLTNLLAATAAALALGVVPDGVLDVRFSAMRGERVELPGGVLVINDCYNANPMSMRAALDDLAATALGRRVAVLGDMLELGPGELALHRDIGAHAARGGVDVLVTVGERAPAIAQGLPQGASVEVHSAADADAASQLLADLLRSGDTVLVKASRGMRLERITEALQGRIAEPARGGRG